MTAVNITWNICALHLYESETKKTLQHLTQFSEIWRTLQSELPSHERVCGGVLAGGGFGGVALSSQRPRYHHTYAWI